jgi:bacteriochlorophyllide a dehydrogenase
MAPGWEAPVKATAIVFERPGAVSAETIPLNAPGADDVVVETLASGISTGTERLLWDGRMPEFPGMGYPLVPGYEAVGTVVDAGRDARSRVGDFVFVPGSNGFAGVRGLFGAAASHLVTGSRRAMTLDAGLGRRAILIALAATAHHAVRASPLLPELIVGHGVLGRLMARIVVALGGPAPTVWETRAERMGGTDGYAVMPPDDDTRRDYARICEASGDPAILDRLTPRLAHGGEIVIAGFYDRLSFAFPPAFMKEATLRIAAEWQAGDIEAVTRLVDQGRLSLDGLLTHSGRPQDAAGAYRQAFADPNCLKMTIDWREAA